MIFVSLFPVLLLTWLLEQRQWWPLLVRAVAGTGALMNAAAVLANGGYMPVLGKESAHGLWIPLEESHRLTALVDRYGGFSLGDIILGSAALAAITIWIITSALRETKRKTVASAEITVAPVAYNVVFSGNMFTSSERDVEL